MANLPFAAQDYKDALLEDVLPFWLKHGLDSPEEGGGYLNSLEADGSVFDTDKPVWFCGRMSWVLASCALTFRDDPRAAEWVKAARIGVDFAERHGFDAEDGQVYFLVTRDGRPLRKRRYVYSESFAAIGFAATARAERAASGLGESVAAAGGATVLDQLIAQAMGAGGKPSTDAEAEGKAEGGGGRAAKRARKEDAVERTSRTWNIDLELSSAMDEEGLRTALLDLPSILWVPTMKTLGRLK